MEKEKENVDSVITANQRFDKLPLFLKKFYLEYPLGDIIILEQLLAMLTSEQCPTFENDNHLSKTFNKWINNYKVRRLEFEPGFDPFWGRLEAFNFGLDFYKVSFLFWRQFWAKSGLQNQTDQYSINEAFHYFLVNEKKLKPKYDLPLREN